jgi:hypothetical protein
MWHVHKTISILLFVFIVQIFTGFGCRENTVDPGGGKGPEFLTAEDIGVTDSYLKITLPFSLRQQPVILKRDTTTIIHSYISANDTLIYDEHLLPNHTYTYTLTTFSGRTFSPDAHLTITTMDTTSHDFAWTIDTLGDGNSSVLYDVAIINDTLAYAVGEIYKKDSLGNWDNEPYGAARWDGNKWNLMKVRYHDYNSTTTYPGILKSVYAFGPNDVYVCSYANLLHGDGSRWTEKAFFMTGIPFTGQVNKIWGTSGSNLYCVGNSGAIYHYNGTSWEKLESGTDVYLLDVWGTPDGNTVWACGREYFKPTVLLRIQNNKVEKVFEDKDHLTVVRGDTLSGVLIGGMLKQNNLFIYSSAGVYQSPLFQTDRTRRLSFTPSLFYTTPSSIGGKGRNDFFISGYFSFIVHFNGYSWYQYNELGNNSVRLQSVRQKGDLVIAVGHIYDPVNSRGVVYIGRR